MIDAAGSARTATGVTLSEIVSALSLALDISEGHPTGHCVRACWLGLHVGRRIGLAGPDLADLCYTILLKDVGCSSNAARICQIYLADDLALKQGFKNVGDSLPQVLRFVLANTGLKADLAARFRALFHIVMHGGEIVSDLFQTRCQTGAEIVRQMGFPEAVARGVLELDERWNGKGHPLGLAGPAIALPARIALMVQIADVFHATGGRDAALAELRARRGTWFDPALVAAFEQASAVTPEFWTMLDSPELPLAVAERVPDERARPLDADRLDDIAHGFARVVDAKSPFTKGHSDRVALFTDMIAEQLGHDGERRRRLKRAALLHDIGKLGVSNQILDKPGRLDSAEWADIRRHPVLGARILSRIGAFAELARIAERHHEKLDGTGYPHGLVAEAIDLDTRIVTVADIFDALTAERPYRKAMSVGAALAILEKDSGTAVDPACLAALRRALDALEDPRALAA